jgi:O-antigen ligase
LLPYIGFGAFVFLPFWVEDEQALPSAAICYVATAISIALYFTLYPQGELRAISDITNPQGISDALVMGMLLSILLWRMGVLSRLVKLLVLLATIIMGVVVILGLSRDTLAGAISAMLILGMLRPGLSRKVKALLLLSLAVTVSGFIAYEIMPQAIAHRVDETFNAPLEKATAARVYFWKAAWINFLEYPLTGTGSHSFLYRYREYLWLLVGHKSSNVVHSMYLEVLAEQGFIGFVPLIAFLVSLFKFGLSRAKDRDLFMAVAIFLAVTWVAASPINSPVYFSLGILSKRLLEDVPCDHRERF